jgi:hypothetical protein
MAWKKTLWVVVKSSVVYKAISRKSAEKFPFFYSAVAGPANSLAVN